MSHSVTNADPLNQVLSALKKDNFPDTPDDKIDDILDGREEPPVKPIEPIDIEAEYRTLLTKISESIANNTEILQAASDLVKMVGDEKTLEAYASVAKSNVELLRTFSTAITEKQKIISTEKLKEKDLIVKKEIANLKTSVNKEASKLASGQTYNIQNNFTLKASRDEMFDAVFGTEDERKKSMKTIMEHPDNIVLEAEISES